MGMFIPLIVVLVGMYFLMIRPQKKQQQQRQELLNAMKPGDKIVTIGGLHGVVSEINSDTNTVVIDCEGIYLEFDRNAVKGVTPEASDIVEETPAEITEKASTSEEKQTESEETTQSEETTEESEKKEDQ